MQVVDKFYFGPKNRLFDVFFLQSLVFCTTFLAMDFKKLWEQFRPHIIAIAIFHAVFALYFHPQFDGKVVEQRDIMQGKGMIKEAMDYHEATGEHTLWTNAMFGGMPTYQISSPQNSNLIRKYIEPAMQLFMKAPLSWFFVAALSFYILMLVLGVNQWVSVIGGLAFALSTNNMILYAEGHTSKFRAISYLPLALAGVYLILSKHRYLKGAALFLLAMSLNIAANHYQMTYYFGIGMVFFMLVYLVFAAKEGEIIPYLKGAGLLLICGILAVGPSFSKIYTTLEYSKFTMRGNSDLKEEAAALKGGPEETSGEGLDWDYAMMWSNSSLDLMATFIPGIVGGASGVEVDKDYPITKWFGNSRNLKAPLYWGGAESTSGPVYYGVIVLFLLILGLQNVKSSGWKWGVVTAFLIIAFLSMGKYFETFNRLFFDNFPKYHIFRAHNSAMGVGSVFFPILALAGLSAFVFGETSKKEKLKQLYIAGGIVGGLSLIIWLIGPSMFSFRHMADENMLYQSFQNNVQQFDQFMDDLIDSREMYLKSSALRSFMFVALAFGVLWALVTNKLKAKFAIVLVGALVTIDLVTVDRTYLNEENFISERKQNKPFTMRPIDEQIKQMEPRGRGYYRVFDMSINTFSSSSTSYFHNTVGGYSAVKMSRIQDVIDSVFRAKDGISSEVLDMFNTKYIIDQKGQFYPSPTALGSAWFVDSFVHVSSATEELNAIRNDFESRTHAVVHDEFGEYSKGLTDHAPDTNTNRSIELTSYQPNRLVYRSNCEEEEFVVFSEIWYGPGVGWEVTIDGQPVEGDYDHIRCNYLLRGMKVPSGKREIIFEFKPKRFEDGERISMASSILILLSIGGWLFAEIKKSK